MVQSEMEIGRTAFETAYSRVMGKAVPRTIFTPVTIVTRENLNNPAIQDLIEPPFRQYLPAPAK